MTPYPAPLRSARLLAAIALGGLLASSILGCSDSSAPPDPKPRLRFVDVSLPVDLTPDGQIALLEEAGSATGDVYFFHLNTGQLEFRTSVGSPNRDLATGISATGRISALHGDPVQAGLWTSAGDWLDLGSPFPAGCGQDIGGAWDVSASGEVTVGLLWDGCTTQAFRWTDASGSGVFTMLDVLGSTPPGSSLAPINRATVVSDDGMVAAGFAQTDLVDRWPAVWQADGSGTLLQNGPFPADAPGEILSISEDGQVVAGIWNQEGFSWSQGSGAVRLGQLPGFSAADPVYPNAIAAGGKLIFGGAGNSFFTIPNAFVWTKARGMRRLQDIASLALVGAPEGYTLLTVLAASTDGSVLLGTAMDPGFNQVTFVLELPVEYYGL